MQRRQFLGSGVAGCLGLLVCGCDRENKGATADTTKATTPAKAPSAKPRTAAATKPAATAAAGDSDELHGCGEIHDDDAVLTAGQPVTGFEGCTHESIEVDAKAIKRQPGAATGDAAVARAEAPRPIARPIAIPRHARDDPLIGRRLARAPVDGGATPPSVAAVPTSEASVDDGPTGKRTSKEIREHRAQSKRSARGENSKVQPNPKAFAKNETPPLGRAKTVARASARQWRRTMRASLRTRRTFRACSSSASRATPPRLVALTRSPRTPPWLPSTSAGTCR